MLSDMTLIVRTARHRYAVRRDDVSEIKLVADASVMANDEGGRPYLGIELGPLPPEELHVAGGAEQAVDLHRCEVRLAEGPELLRVELDLVVGVDDLVGPQQEHEEGGKLADVNKHVEIQLEATGSRER